MFDNFAYILKVFLLLISHFWKCTEPHWFTNKPILYAFKSIKDEYFC